MQSLQVEGEADQRPLTLNIVQTSQRELTKANRLLDDSNHRFNSNAFRSQRGTTSAFGFIRGSLKWGLPQSITRTYARDRILRKLQV